MREMIVFLHDTPGFIIKTKILFCGKVSDKLVVEFWVVFPLIPSQLPYFSSVLLCKYYSCFINRMWKIVDQWWLSCLKGEPQMKKVEISWSFQRVLWWFFCTLLELPQVDAVQMLTCNILWMWWPVLWISWLCCFLSRQERCPVWIQEPCPHRCKSFET